MSETDAVEFASTACLAVSTSWARPASETNLPISGPVPESAKMLKTATLVEIAKPMIYSMVSTNGVPAHQLSFRYKRLRRGVF